MDFINEPLLSFAPRSEEANETDHNNMGENAGFKSDNMFTNGADCQRFD